MNRSLPEAGGGGAGGARAWEKVWGRVSKRG